MSESRQWYRAEAEVRTNLGVDDTVIGGTFYFYFPIYEGGLVTALDHAEHLLEAEALNWPGNIIAIKEVADNEVPHL